MRALSIKQPWIYCITDLGKRVENRSWKPPNSIIHQCIALHASKQWDNMEAREIASDVGNFDHYLVRCEAPRGAIVATAVIWGWLSDEPNPDPKHVRNNKWFAGPYGWLLSEVKKLSSPIPCKGNLGLWHVDDEIVKEINLQEERGDENRLPR